MKVRTALPDDLKNFMRLVQAGKLFAVQDWIKSGKQLRLVDSNQPKTSVLYAAVESGFHSMVEELLRAGGWSVSELSAALDLARSTRRFDLAELLSQRGARPKPLDFEASCDKLDLFMMERHLRAGTNPNDGNVFAQILDSKKARPLLGFYRQFRAEFPALEDQTALALAEAVKNNQLRWTALLAWAGADPFRQVPNNLYEPFSVDPDNCTTAAGEAVWRNRPDILKALNLKPTPTQALELLSHVIYLKDTKLVQNFLGLIPRDKINHTPRASSAALECLVSRSSHHNIFTDSRNEEEEVENLKRLELLLDAGACWNPAPEELRYVRRNLLDHDNRYIVQLLRLLLYTPDAVNLDSFLELCRSQTLMSRIGLVDIPLVRELQALRKTHRPFNDGDASAKTGIVPAAEAAHAPAV
jgi:hypothetical protein